MKSYLVTQLVSEASISANWLFNVLSLLWLALEWSNVLKHMQRIEYLYSNKTIPYKQAFNNQCIEYINSSSALIVIQLRQQSYCTQKNF